MSTKVKTGSSPLPDSTLLAALPPPTNEHLALVDLDSSSTTHVRVEISKETVADYTDLLKEGRCCRASGSDVFWTAVDRSH